ncbi:hypothetical protein [Allokutzneria oryzae]|uniref:Uncharacterized protein n=1 Tax=Allokutzneria oryzae TaxID=1378989 RepID=A0ABV6A616_9PSEU
MDGDVSETMFAERGGERQHCPLWSQLVHVLTAADQAVATTFVSCGVVTGGG